MSTAIYARVSTDEQHADMQIEDLKRYCWGRGWDVRQYTDEGYSGAVPKRPALDSLMEDVRAGRIKRIIVWRFDRMARNTKHMLELMEFFNSFGCTFVSMHENFDTSTPFGKAMLTIIAAIAELEKSTIRDRMRAGIKRAQQKGVRVGRPKKVFDRLLAKEMLDAGCTQRAVAEHFGVSQGLVWKAFRK